MHHPGLPPRISIISCTDDRPDGGAVNVIGLVGARSARLVQETQKKELRSVALSTSMH